MKLFRHYFVFVSSLFLILNDLHSQSLGIDFGTGVYNTSITYNATIGHIGIPNPQNFLINFSYPIYSNIDILVAGGYGIGHYSNKFESETSEQDNFTNDTRLSGGLFESEILFKDKISKDSKILIFAGLGLGYYSYSFKEELSKDPNYLREADINGFSQYYTLGLGFNLSDRMKPYIKFKKMGYSIIKIKNPPPDYNDEITTIADVTSSSGLTDVGISFGIQYRIGK